MMSHYCFSVSNVEQMRTYLRSKGIDVKPGNGGKTRTGDYAFEIKDPDGTLVEFVQSLPTGIEMQDAGKFLPPTRIAGAIYHVGFLVGNLDKSLAFYEGILGFTETWRGSSNGKELSWVNLRVPDGKDYIELMLYDKTPSGFGTKNHVSLLVPDVQKAVDEIESRAAYKDYLTHAKTGGGAGRQERQAPGESLRPGRNTSGADGRADCRRKAGATLYCAASGAGA